MTTVVTPECKRALDQAKLALMLRPDSVFFTTVCFSMKHLWDDGVPTACTNGKVITFSPAFFMSLTKEEQIFLMIHETMHVAYQHMVRRGEREKGRFNMACDYVINYQLVERGFKMPKCGLYDPQFAGMSAEQVYDLLPEGSGADFEIDVIEGDGNDAEGKEKLSQEIQDILVRARIQSKLAGEKPGTIPGDIEVMLDELLNPKLPWNKILLKYLHALSKDDYSFRRPNRRFFPRFHLPSLHSEKLMDLAIAVDISGSVSDEEFKAFVSEIASIFRMMKPENITVIQFDTEIQSIDKVKSIPELLKIKFSGRGGTDIRPVLEWLNTTSPKPQLLMMFTDGGFNFPNMTTTSDVIWLIHNDRGQKWTAPFGKVIHYGVPC